MSGVFKAARVTDHVYWVGAIDWSIRDFHGYLTSRGSTYNAYLILADKITLVDTVKRPFREEMLSRIASVIDPGDITYIISNHSEMDHSGCLPEVIQAVKPEKVFASVMGANVLAEHFHLDREIVAVKDGESVSLGNMNVSFVETRMLHWPDSMFTYLAEDGVLFSQDAFSMHLASSERFDDEIDDDILDYEAAKYFANILLPLSSAVVKCLEKMRSLDITMRIVATDHGPIWRKDVNRIVELYSRWAAQKPTKKAVVAYDTMWQSTAMMARAIGEGLKAGGADAKLMPLRACHRSDVATEILDAGALLVGSPTLNNNLFPTVADALTYLKGLKPRNLIGAAFGSYGWSGEAVGQVEDVLRGMKVDLIGESIKVKYVPDDEALARCYSQGMLVAEKLRELCQ
ncbi:MAG: FprA family A-type flavoprotein [Candidatus Thermoplasmatota archaeon]|nr:FprA family A-type flavoprotein [Candidatus Thermoplasmatota archaeon]